MISKKKLGEDLNFFLKKNQFDIVKISRWAEHINTVYCRELTSELDDIIMAIASMEHGPEFEFSEKELFLLAELLINEEADPIKKIQDSKSKKSE